MAIQFILGRSGTGKTHYCVRAITRALLEDARARLIFLVPEQATFQVERAVLAQAELSGFDQLSILSFDRLHYQLLGGAGTRKRLSTVGRQMALHRILQEHAGQLSVYRSSCANPGFVTQLMRILDQLQAYANGPEDLTRCIEQLRIQQTGAMCAAKLQDIQILLRAYMSFIEGRFLDPMVEFNSLRGAVQASSLLDQARLWVDGFSGFTRSEFLMLKAMLETASETHMAFCLDPEHYAEDGSLVEADPLDLFAPTWDTFRELRELVQTLNLPEVPPVLLTETHRFRHSQALAHVECGLFSAATERRHADQSVLCGAASDERHEVKAIARQIRQMVAEEGIRYRDIAVIASDLGRYEHYIQAYFSDYGLPFFMDKQRALVHHPCATLICSALHMVQNGFNTAELLAYLRTGLTSLDAQAIDSLENYCLAFGIGARDWSQNTPWAFDDPSHPLFDEAAVNRTRESVVTPLLGLRQQFFDRDRPKPVTGQDLVGALATLLEQLQVLPALKALIQAAEQGGEPERADMHRQFWDWLTGLLDECQDTLGSYRAPIDFFAGLLRSAFSQMCMALIPPCLDQILVGSIERSRHPELKVVFLLGTTQRQFPAPLPKGGLLSDRDRDQAALAGLCLDAGLTQTLSQRRYLAYIAFTRPSERLIVSYPLADEKGNAVVRSQFIDDLERLFDDLPVCRLDAGADSQAGIEEAILCQHELADFVCAHGQAERLLQQLAMPELLHRFQHAVRAGAQPRDVDALDPDALSDQFGSMLTTSASQLSSFAACPFQYFARYTLGLKVRQELVLEPLDLGNFYHKVLEYFVQTVMRSQQDWTASESADLLPLLDQVIERFMQSDSRLMAFMRHSATNAFVIHGACDVLRAAVPELATMIRAGQFRPAYTEAAFGMGTRELGDFELDLPDQAKVALQGVVDRIDLSGPGAEARALVFDYKRRERKPDWTGLFYGLDLQLGIYMLALRNAHEQGLIDAPVAGAFFLPVEVPSVKAGLTDPKAKLLRFKRKARGLFDADIADMLDPREQGESQFYNFFKKKDGTPLGHYAKRGSLEHARFELLLHFVRDKIKALSQAIMAGQVVVRPCKQGSYTPCAYCPYRPLCRFDGQIHEVRYLQGQDKTQVLEKLEEIYGC
jgi:ATP-dependent helicase/nuclease subunit B